MSAPVKTAVLLSLLILPVATACTAHRSARPAISEPPPRTAAPSVTASPATEVATADQAAIAGTEALESFDTTLDASPRDTAARAAHTGLLTPGFAAAVEAFRRYGSPGAQWIDWAAHRAYVRAEARLGGDDHPPDRPTSAHRQVVVTLTPLGRDGWTGTPITKVVAVTLARTPGGAWLIAGFTSA